MKVSESHMACTLRRKQHVKEYCVSLDVLVLVRLDVDLIVLKQLVQIYCQLRFCRLVYGVGWHLHLLFSQYVSILWERTSLYNIKFHTAIIGIIWWTLKDIAEEKHDSILRYISQSPFMGAFLKRISDFTAGGLPVEFAALQLVMDKNSRSNFLESQWTFSLRCFLCLGWKVVRLITAHRS